MKKIILDCNIYDDLVTDSDTAKLIKNLVAQSKIQIIIPATVKRELEPKYKGIPVLSPGEYTVCSDSVFILGETPLGDGRLGPGEVFNDHRGKSKNRMRDAIIADTASTDADALVSNDIDMGKRARASNNKAQFFNYYDFKVFLDSLQDS